MCLNVFFHVAWKVGVYVNVPEPVSDDRAAVSVFSPLQSPVILELVKSGLISEFLWSLSSC